MQGKGKNRRSCDWGVSGTEKVCLENINSKERPKSPRKLWGKLFMRLNFEKLTGDNETKFIFLNKIRLHCNFTLIPRKDRE